jgi:hypothetical protein
MELPTPESSKTLEIDQFGVGGNGKVMIWALLENDPPENEMAEMSDLLQVILTQKGCFGGRLDSRGSVKHMGNKLSLGRSLIVTGHSRFTDPDGNVLAMSERKLGGFPVDDVLAELLIAVQLKGVNYITFWCCETACKRGSDKWNGDAKKQIINKCDLYDFRGVNDNVKNKSWSEVSTLDYITMTLAAELVKDQFMCYQVCLTGLNGVGHFEKGDKYIQTFDRVQMLGTVNEILKLEKVVGTKAEGQYDKKNLHNAEKRLNDHIKTKLCHYITYIIDTKSLKYEIKLKQLKLADLVKYKKIMQGQM